LVLSKVVSFIIHAKKSPDARRLKSWYGKGSIDDRLVIILKPQSNESERRYEFCGTSKECYAASRELVKNKHHLMKLN
jgi:hypothetical protein